MASVRPINISALNLTTAGTDIAGQLQSAAVAPFHTLPTPAAASAVDVAAAGAAEAIRTQMATMSSKLTTKSSELQSTTDAGAAAMQAQDANNASPLKDLASVIPSGGGSRGSSGSNSSGAGTNNGKVSMLDSHQQDMYGTPEPPSQPPPPGKVWTFIQADPITHQGHWEPGEPLHDCSGFHEGAGVAGIVGSAGPIVLNPILGTLSVLGPDLLTIDDIGQCK